MQISQVGTLNSCLTMNEHKKPSALIWGHSVCALEVTREGANMVLKTVLIVALFCGCWANVCAKVYDRCDLAHELKNVYKFPEDQIATWVCLARHESLFNTSAVGHMNWDGSGDHGLFQISDLYWCSPPGNGWACGVTCAQLEDDDIADDVACVKRIHRQHQRLTGDGFTAWAVYRAHCTADLVGKYLDGCDAAATPTTTTSTAEPDVGNELSKSEAEEEEEVINVVDQPSKTDTVDSVNTPDHVDKLTNERVQTVQEITEKSTVGRSYHDLSLTKQKPNKRFFAKLFEYVYMPA